MLLLPNGSPATVKREPLDRGEIDLVLRFEHWLERRGLRMDLICDRCVDEGLHPRCHGDNGRNEATYKIVCAHAERVYGVPLTGH